MSAVTAFCAALVARRYLSTKDERARDILLDETKVADVRSRLEAVGLRLVQSVFSNYVGYALLNRDEDGEDLVEAAFGKEEPGRAFTTAGLQRDELALAMLLWLILCLPKRQPEDAALTQAKLSTNTLMADYPWLGHPRVIKTKLTRLWRLDIIAYTDEHQYIVEGPLMEILFEGNAISQKIASPTFRDALRNMSITRTKANADLVGRAEQEEGTNVLDQ